MPVIVSVQDVVREMDILEQDCCVYLNRQTGDFLLVTEEERALAEQEDNSSNIPAWMVEDLPRIREALRSEDWIELPSIDRSEDYQIMERFCCSVRNETLREELLDAIQRPGAFERFRSLMRRYGLLEKWETFRTQHLESVARIWLENAQIPHRP